MNKSKINNVNGEILTLKQASLRVNLGISSVRRLADECGAALKIGRSYRIDIQKLLEYLRGMTKGNEDISKKPQIPVEVQYFMDLGINQKSSRSLCRYGYRKIEELKNFDLQDLLELRNVGTLGAAQILNAVNHHLKAKDEQI